MAFFDNFDWGSFLGKAVPAVVGGVVASNANNDAANIAQQNAANNRAVVQQQNDKALAILQPRIAAGAPATGYFRQVMAQDPYRLTPQQQISLDDTTMAANRGVPTALRGSGRAVSAMVNDTTTRAKAGFVGQNMARSDAAAGRLESSGDAAATNAANLTAGQGTQVTNINTGAAQDQGNAATANGSVANDTIGNIGSYFANAAKADAIKGQYGAPRTVFEM